MGIVLDKAANSHQSVHCAGWFVAVAFSKFGKAKRQVAPAFKSLIENFNMAGAVHGFYRHISLARQSFEHIGIVFVCVTAFYPKGFIHYFWGNHLFVASLCDLFANKIFQHIHKHRSVRVPKHHAGAVVFYVV